MDNAHHSRAHGLTVGLFLKVGVAVHRLAVIMSIGMHDPGGPDRHNTTPPPGRMRSVNLRFRVLEMPGRVK